MIMILLNGVATAMMLTGVNVALPDIAKDLNVDARTLSWIPMGYLVASAASVLAFGRLADMYGRKKFYLMGTLGVIISSVLTSLSQDVGQLIAGRVVQGICAGALYSTMFAVLSSVYPESKRGEAIGYSVSAVYLGLALGPFIAGLVIEAFSWRLAFLLHVPLALVVLYIGSIYVKTEWRTDEFGTFDALGSLLYATGVVCFMLGVASGNDSRSIPFLLVGAFLIYRFVKHEKTHRYPVFDVHMFFNQRVFSMSCLASLLMYTATFSTVVLVSLYLQYLKAISPSQAGLILMIQPAAMAGLSPFVGRLSDKIEPRVLASLGMVVTACGLGRLALVDSASEITPVVMALFAIGLGFSLFSTPNAHAIMGSSVGNDYGRAASAMSVMRVLGQMMSMGMVALVFTSILGSQKITVEVYDKLDFALGVCFSAGTALCLTGVILSLARGRLHGR
ncbi:MAG: MFS transporter [Pseudomonadota bacterium]|nr:MFS transporter [Pseudomonadota bacterium]